MSFSQTGSTIKSKTGGLGINPSLLNKPGGLFGNKNTVLTGEGSNIGIFAKQDPFKNVSGQISTKPILSNLPTYQSKPTASNPVVTKTSGMMGPTYNPVKTGSKTGSTSQDLGSTDTSGLKTGGTSPKPGMMNLGDIQPQTQYKNDANLYGTVVTGLANTPKENTEVNEALRNRETLQNEYQKQNNLIQSRGWDLSEQAGAQGMLKQSYNTANAAAEDRVQNALTAQTNQINALDKAGNLAKPILGSVGQVPFNPTLETQGSYLGTTGGNSLNEIGKTLGQFTGAQTTAENQYVQTEAYKSAHQQAQNLQSQLGNLISSMGLNPNDLNVANQGLQLIARNTSDSRYQILQNYITDVASRYAQVLTPTGGSQTDTVRDTAQGMINGLASGNSILQVLNSLDQQAQAVSAGVNTNNTGSVKGPTTSNSGSGSITPKGGLSF